MELSLKTFDNTTFDKGAGKFKQALWYVLHAIFIKSPLFPFMGMKIWLLRVFGASIGEGLIIKPSVHIKFPWKFKTGKNVWIGEHVWIDNLDTVELGNDVCISQGALLLTGNHDYTLPSFDFKNAPINLHDGVWIGAKAIVCPGVTCGSHAILSVGSVANRDLEPFSIYRGNPAVSVRKRVIKTS